MKNHLKLDKFKIYFLIICGISLSFFLSPLLIRIPCIYTAIHNYLAVFTNIEYKSTYIETMGAIWGTFLAITGAIWAQKLSNKHEKTIQIEKSALIMYYDFKFALDSIVDIVTFVYPLIKSNTLPEDEIIIDKFRKSKRKYRIYINSNWRQLVTSLRDELTVDEIREAQLIYSKLAMISMSFNASVVETSRKEDKNSYSLMLNMVDVQFALKEPIVYEISLKSSTKSLIDKIAKIAHIET